MRVVGIGDAKSNQIMKEVKMEMLVVVMFIMRLVMIEMKAMLSNAAAQSHIMHSTSLCYISVEIC